MYDRALKLFFESIYSIIDRGMKQSGVAMKIHLPT